MNESNTIDFQAEVLPVIQFGAAIPQTVLDEVDGGKGDDSDE